MSTLNEIRGTFIDFFRKNGHEHVPSSPLVPRNDPTLMFTNAGMVQFKNVFTGMETLPYKRAVTAQKCVRAGGKHNDLDNVGYTARHHTFFEMLGNFSFGDYFKERAIELAWTLVTKEYGLDKKRLLVTVFSEDDDAHALWKKIAGLPDDRIIRIPTSDNFWSMGETGPCGPCSEIFFDHGPKVPGGPPGSEDADGDRFIEIWNLVFMQYEQVSKTERLDLPRPSIDTGMGLERVAAVLQGVHNNYDTDLFQALIRASVDATGVPAEGAALPSHRVIADHLRASAFLIADGVLPSNEGRGYVLRRIMRRAMRHSHLLGAEEPLLYRLLPVLVREMGQAYPELVRGQALIGETLKIEEVRFRRTLARGLSLLDDASGSLGAGDTFSGDVAFKLYDTYGFPLDLTQDALKARSISVDIKQFNAAMAQQKAEARKAWAGSGEAATDKVWFDVLDQAGATEFLGYETEAAEGQIVAIVKDGKPVKQLKTGEEGILILNQTPFYGESGGQVGDRGVIIAPKSAHFDVSETQKKLGKLFAHVGTVKKGPLKVGDAVEMQVDHARRTAIRANHSATHLLHEALRETLGTHVTQKGSLVDPDKLRFDFSHPKPLSKEELAAVEELANAVVLRDSPVVTRLMAVDDAVAAGAMALFGEKYGEEVRVVSMGEANHDERGSRAFSVELCGGTHVRATGEIGLVKVVQETAVAAGVRRIEALTANAARLHLSHQEAALRQAAELLRVAPSEVPARLQNLIDERKKLERELADAKKKIALGTGGDQAGAENPVRQVGDVTMFARTVQGIQPKDLRSLVDDGKRQIGSGIVAIVGVTDDGKAGIVVGVTGDLTKHYSAVDLVKAGAAAVGGQGGGGRPDLAQAGGPNGANAEAALNAIAECLASATAAA
ncbi:alanyl-tRNA synthetase [Rhodomicrobium vannielii ATCC 17100]|uniref:Alanine--tRNA ligase n=1 Tax=Rhodomicrobium vannielii (strain ATCC 17100 / DSM 162 / LMG 4299 / NCIMB 10020 / ATH 3.1.1) TaxID=648757 RepID=E3I0A9_RHOVT|nr:alanine--tRNA ligase [Rhodomicrobium vannielii]ADP72227.1 alanyl-tRNA synthetase [Rhodomicrobium vannielii ATCC 17100]